MIEQMKQSAMDVLSGVTTETGELPSCEVALPYWTTGSKFVRGWTNQFLVNSNTIYIYKAINNAYLISSENPYSILLNNRPLYGDYQD